MNSQIHQTKLNLVNPQVIDMKHVHMLNTCCWSWTHTFGKQKHNKRQHGKSWRATFSRAQGLNLMTLTKCHLLWIWPRWKWTPHVVFFWQPIEPKQCGSYWWLCGNWCEDILSKEKRHYGNLYIYMLCCICFWSPTIFAIPSRLSSSAAAEGPGASKGAAASSSRNSKCSGVEGASGAPWAVSKPRNRKMNNKWRMKVVATQNMWIPVCTLCSTTILDIHVSVCICGVDCICEVNCICEECISVS